jgi:hypothetical protein
MRAYVHLLMVLASALSGNAALAVQGHQHVAGDPEQLGAVEFTTSCFAEAQAQLARATAMLHSFWYDEAGERFRGAAEARRGKTTRRLR